MISIDSPNSSTLSTSLENIKTAWNALQNRADIGFTRLPEQDQIWAESEKVASQILSKFEYLIVIGIGGSSLGAESVIRTLAPPRREKVIFIDNYDLDDIHLKTSHIKLSMAAIYVVSKSGNSLYTLSVADYFISRLKSLPLPSWQAHIWVCTEFKSSPLFDWAKRLSLPLLELPINVGGRFSVFTAAGLLPIAFSGVDLRQLRAGALSSLKNMDSIFSATAFFADCFQQGHSNTFFWFYSSMMKGFGPWLVQLWSESLGKANSKATVPTVCIGTIDQHSMLQQISEGELKENVVFFRFDNLENNQALLKTSEFSNFSYWTGYTMGDIMRAEFQGTCDALASRKIPHLSFRVPGQSAEHLGSLLMFFELLVGVLGISIGIDPFNQPGVELSKKLTREILSSPKRTT